MRPNFKNIDITKDAFAHSAGKVAHEGENWITPESPGRIFCHKDVIPGSIIATLAWFLISFFYSYYTNNYSNYEVIYGSIGGIIVLITWLYLSSWSILIGLEVNVRLYFRKLKRQKGSV